MILNLSKGDISVLLLNMTITRKNVRNGFKRNYGKTESKEILASFDEVKQSLEEIIDPIEENEEVDPKEMHIIHHNIKEIDMIHSFLLWYLPKLRETLEEATKGRLNDEDQKQLEVLERILVKVDNLKEVNQVV